MATKKKKKNGINIASLIITVLAVALAVGAIIFLLKTTGSDEEAETTPTQPAVTEFMATQELVDATQQAAYDLLPKNYKVFQYLTRGMTHEDEPYGNLPEDGFYTCVSDEFNNFDDFSDYIKGIYTEKTAEKLLTDPFGNGPVYGVDDTGALGLSSDFTPNEEEDLSWADVHFLCTPVSETECTVKVTLKDSSDNDVDKEVMLVLENGEWKLAELVG